MTDELLIVKIIVIFTIIALIIITGIAIITPNNKVCVQSHTELRPMIIGKAIMTTPTTVCDKWENKTNET